MRWREMMPTSRAADDGKLLLKRVHAAIEGVGESVGGREGGKVGEHDFAHAHGVDHRLEEDALILDLRADHDEEAGEADPVIVEQDAGKDGDDGETLSQAGGGAAGGGHAVFAGKCVADQAAAIERVGRNQVEKAEKYLQPDQAAQ